MSACKRGIWIAIFLALMIGCGDPAVAQSSPLQPVYSGIAASNMNWSSDSLLLAFQVREFDFGVQVSDESWFKYDTNSATLTQGNRWALQPALTRSEQQIFLPYMSSSSDETFIFQSPNGRYLVFGGNRNLDNVIPLKIADRQLIQTTDLSIDAGSPILDTETFSVWWSGDSSSFVVLTSSIATNSPYYHYVSNYAASLANVTVQRVWILTIDSQRYGIVTIHDLSHDGDGLLANVAKADIGSRDEYVMLSSFSAPSSSRIIPRTTINGNQVIGASFRSDDESKSLIVNDVGLVQYDTLTQTVTVLRTDINSTLFKEAVFSPDGKWLALTTDTQVYVVNIVNDLPNR